MLHIDRKKKNKIIPPASSSPPPSAANEGNYCMFIYFQVRVQHVLPLKEIYKLKILQMLC